jgi:hypothetical protein
VIKRNKFKTTKQKVAKGNEDSAMRFLIRENPFPPVTIQTFLRLCLPFAPLQKQATKINKKEFLRLCLLFSNKIGEELFSKQL